MTDMMEVCDCQAGDTWGVGGAVLSSRRAGSIQGNWLAAGSKQGKKCCCAQCS